MGQDPLICPSSRTAEGCCVSAGQTEFSVNQNFFLLICFEMNIFSSRDEKMFQLL